MILRAQCTVDGNSLTLTESSDGEQLALVARCATLRQESIPLELLTTTVLRFPTLLFFADFPTPRR